MKRAVLLLNLGGPETLSEVKPFLYNFFSDPDIITGVPSFLRKLFAFTISRLKHRSSERMYSKIGGGSPQRKWTEAQARLLREAFHSNDNQIDVDYGMRVWTPTIRDALESLREKGAEELILFPLFPQFSTTTTGSCFNEVDRSLIRMNWQPEIKRISSWPDHPAYIAFLKKTVLEKVNELQQKKQLDSLHVLISAHSLPVRIIEKGDPYLQEVQKTVHALTQALKNEFSCQISLVFQSKTGPVKWLEPDLHQELGHLISSGIKNLIIVPISFVCDHIETLYELDILYADYAAKQGLSGYCRTRMFNDDPEFIQMIRSIVSERYRFQ